MRNPSWYDSLRHALSNDPAVCLAYLFGSYAKGREMAESDVDIGVYLRKPYDEGDRDRIWGLIEDLTECPVDLVVINDAPPLIAAAAMEGKPLFIRDPYVELITWLRISAAAMDFTDFVDSFWKERERAKGGGTS